MGQKILCCIFMLLNLLGATSCGFAFGRELMKKYYDFAFTYLAIMIVFLIGFAITMFAGLFV